MEATLDASTRASTPRERGLRFGLPLVGRLDLVALAVFCGVCFFLGLDRGELWRTEGLRGLIARSMFESGDWIVPRLFGEPHFTKPPGFYVAVVLCSLPFGEVTELSARLPSAIAATMSVFLFAWYFGRHLGRGVGLAAGLILPVSFLWLDKSSSAEIDMMQATWVTASILLFLRATEPDAGDAWPWWLASMLCVAGGFLTKWTGPQFFYFFTIPYLAIQGRLRLLFKAPHLVGLLLATALCAAWIGIAIARTGADIFFATVMHESLPRFVPTYYEKAFSPAGAFFLPAKVWASLLPWSLPALLALRPGFAARLDPRGRQMLLALHCWAWPSLGFWMLANEHATRHSFPLAPAFAGFAVLVWHGWATGRLPWRWTRINPVVLLVAVCVGWITMKLAFVTLVVPKRADARQARHKAERIASLVPEGATLHHTSWNRDESLFFYYRRPACRHHTLDDVPSGTVWFLRFADWDAETCPGRIIGRVANEWGQPAAVIEMGTATTAESPWPSAARPRQ
jgi:4-amino-4-deoxy-L-arabinose transferase-like glycosyltransferase